MLSGVQLAKSITGEYLILTFRCVSHGSYDGGHSNALLANGVTQAPFKYGSGYIGFKVDRCSIGKSRIPALGLSRLAHLENSERKCIMTTYNSYNIRIGGSGLIIHRAHNWPTIHPLIAATVQPTGRPPTLEPQPIDDRSPTLSISRYNFDVAGSVVVSPAS